MTGVVFPLRGLHVAHSILPGGGVTGQAVDCSAFAGRPEALVTFGAAIAADKTVTFQSAQPQAGNAALPDAATWTTILDLDICNDNPGNLTVTLDVSEPPYSVDGEMTVVVPMPCPTPFVRAILSAAAEATVSFIGTARNKARA